MKRFGILGAVTAGALVSALAVGPGAAPAGANEIRVAGKDGTMTWYKGSTKLGYAEFRAYGEHLYGCDKNADGDAVYARLEWGNRTGYADDPNGAKPGCGHKDLEIKEGVTAYLKVCIKGKGCTKGLAVRA